MTNPLPHGWALTRIAEIFSAHGGGTPSRSNSSLWNGSIPWLSSGDIKSDIVGEATETITEAGLAESSARLCRPGSVLVVVRSGILKHTLPVAITSRRAAINQDIKCFDSGNNDLNRWLAIVLRASERMLLAENREGTTVQSVKFETLQTFSLAIPPLNEQLRIVEKLEKLLDKVDSCRKRLAKIPILLKRFRQAVLAAGCSGRLTADWRERNPELEPAGEALRKHSETTAKRPRNTRRMKPAVGLTLLDFSDEIPTSWSWLKIRDLIGLGAIIDVQDGNHGELYPRPEDFGNSGVPYISAEHVINDCVLIHKAPMLKMEKASRLRIGFARARDVILTHNATVGRVAIVPENTPKVILSTSTTYYRPDQDILVSGFLAMALRSQFFQRQLETIMEQTTRNQVSVTKQVELSIPVAPAREQHEIVRRVNQLFVLTDQIEARYAKAKQYVDSLKQSILAKAFRGELVQQDPNDEPASVLLERIREVRGTQATNRSRRR